MVLYYTHMVKNETNASSTPNHQPKEAALTLSSLFSRFPSSIINLPSMAGKVAARKVLFGECSRYAVAPVHSRFGSVQWFVWDAEEDALTGLPKVIRQEDSLKGAVSGYF